MLVVRYFVFVGGALLALLLVTDAYLPKPPVEQSADADLPVDSHPFRSQMAASGGVRYQPSDDRSRADDGERPGHCDGRRHLGQGAGARGICAVAAAGSRSGPTGPNETGQPPKRRIAKRRAAPAGHAGGATAAIRVVRQQHLVSRLSSRSGGDAPLTDWTARPASSIPAAICARDRVRCWRATSCTRTVRASRSAFRECRARN